MPLLWLALAFLGGIGLASLVPGSTENWLWGAIGSGAFIFAIWLIRRARRLPTILRRGLDWFWELGLVPGHPGLPAIVLWLAGVLCLGAARYQSDRPVMDDGWLAGYNDHSQAWVVTGELAAPPDPRDGYTNLLVEARELRPASGVEAHPVHGRFLAQVGTRVELAYGDRVTVRGVLTTPDSGEDFSYQAYLARKGIYALMPQAEVRLVRRAEGFSLQGWLYQVQGAALNLCYRLYPDPEASLVAGVLLGADRGLPPRVNEAFKVSGIAHIVAISGFNITILAGLFLKLFERAIGRWSGALVAGIGLAAYTLMTGAEASAVRAAWMGGLALLAAQIGRRQDGLNSLGLAAAVMTWFEPDVPWEVGFQLSFAATMGLIILGGPLSERCGSWLQARLPGALGLFISALLADYVLLTLAAQALTLPLMVTYFQRISLVALAANLVVLPAQPALLVWSGLSVLAGLAWQPAGQMIAILAWPLARFTIAAAETFARLPGAQVSAEPIAPWAVLTFYLLVTGLFLTRLRWLPVMTKFKNVLSPGLVLFLLAAAALAAWRAAAQTPDGNLHLVMLDVSSGGQSGEALLVQTPGGRFVLINGGPSLARLSDGLGQRLPLNNRRLDWLVVAGVRESQIEPLSDLLLRYPPEQVLWAGDAHGSRSARALSSALNGLQIPEQTAVSGQTLDLGDEAQLKILFANSSGAALLLEWHSFRALLPVGVDEAGVKALQGGSVLGPVSVIFLPHAGASAYCPPEWRIRLQPQVVLLSVSPLDSDGRPDAEILDTWRDFTLLRTDQHGWVDVATDGQQMWIQVEKP